MKKSIFPPIFESIPPKVSDVQVATSVGPTSSSAISLWARGWQNRREGEETEISRRNLKDARHCAVQDGNRFRRYTSPTEESAGEIKPRYDTGIWTMWTNDALLWACIDATAAPLLRCRIISIMSLMGGM
jgi:hypothetical protein